MADHAVASLVQANAILPTTLTQIGSAAAMLLAVWPTRRHAGTLLQRWEPVEPTLLVTDEVLRGLRRRRLAYFGLYLVISLATSLWVSDTVLILGLLLASGLLGDVSDCQRRKGAARADTSMPRSSTASVVAEGPYGRRRDLRSRRRKAWVSRPVALGAALLMALVMAGCATTISGVPAASTGVLVTTRPDYPPPGPAVADYGALVSEPGGEAVAYRGVSVVQACDLFTLDDIPSAGLRLLPGTSDGLVSRTYFDGQGDADLPVEPRNLLAEDNTCYYILGEDTARTSITLQVHQPSYVGQKAIDNELRDRYRAGASMGEVEVFEPVRPFGEFTVRWLRYRDVYVELTVDTMPQTQAVLGAVAARLPSVADDPSGPRRFGYRSPTFPTRYVNGCEISTADDFRAMFQVEPSPSVEEGLAPGIGRIRYDNGLEANYVHHRCARRTSQTYFDGGSSLTVAAMSFDSVEGVVEQLASIRSLTGMPDTPVQLGDESVYGLYHDEEAIVFRAGTAMIALSLADGSGRLAGDSAYEALLPAAIAIADRTPR